jgi:CBS domain-containing protein
MNLRDVMTNDVKYVTAETPVTTVAKLMSDLDVGCIPVCDQNGMIQGIITDRDIVLREVAQGKDPNQMMAREVMTSNIISATPDTDVHTASKMMAENQIRRLPVVENNKIVGIIALGDLAVNPSLQNDAESALQDISKGHNTMI